MSEGSPRALFNEAPQNIFEKSEYNPRKQRDVGLKDYMMKKMLRKDKRGKGLGSGLGGKSKKEPTQEESEILTEEAEEETE